MIGTRLFRLLPAGAAGALLLICNLAGPADVRADAFVFKAAVADVTDGDTIVVFRNQTRLTVNLLGVDAPELDQPFGPEAKRLTAKLVKGQVVTIQTTQATNPLYANVWFKKDKNLATELVRSGLAWTKSEDKFSLIGQAQSAAKAAKIGLWEDEDPIPPWEWRTGRRPK